MKAIPLILSTADVKAIIEGRKVRHSVPVKVKYMSNSEIASIHKDGSGKGWIAWTPHPISAEETVRAYPGNEGFASPFGSPGGSKWQTGMPPEDGMYWVDGFGVPVRLIPTPENNSIGIIRFANDDPEQGVNYGVTPENSHWKRMGSILYVREAWRLKGWDFEEDTMLIEYATGEKKNCRVYDPTEDGEWLMNQVEMLESKGYIIATSSERFEFTDKQQPFNSPVTMPREASRIYLEITDVTCKRVQEITEEEAKAEGIVKIDYGTRIWGSASVDDEKIFHPFKPQPVYGYSINPNAKQENMLGTARAAFGNHWTSRYGYNEWINNDFVFSATFKVLSTNGKPSYL